MGDIGPSDKGNFGSGPWACGSYGSMMNESFTFGP